MRTALTILISCLFSVNLSFTATRYVNIASTNPVAPYLSWSTASTNIQNAIDVSITGDEILVASGTYLLNRSIVISNDIVLRGVSNVVVTRDASSYTSRLFFVNSPSAIIANLIISNGVVTNSNGSGAGVLLFNGIISNCVLTQNKLFSTNNYGYGGGVDLWTGIVVNCRFDNNGASTFNSPNFYGGGVLVRYRASIINCNFGTNTAADGSAICLSLTSSNVLISNCIFTNNLSAYGTVINRGVDIVIRDCIFSNNHANGYGSAITIRTPENMLISNCLIIATNTIGSGTSARGAIYGYGGIDTRKTVIDSCIVEQHYDLDRAAIYLPLGGTLRNCLIWKNTKGAGSVSGAGGVHLGNGRIENCTIIANSGGAAFNNAAGGGVLVGDSYVVNTIIYSNTGAIASNRAHDIFASGTSYVGNCCILSITNESSVVITNLITNNPVLMSFCVGYGRTAVGGDARLQSNSPCINAGTNPVQLVNSNDLAGNPRIDRRYFIIDIGAYEFVYLPLFQKLGLEIYGDRSVGVRCRRQDGFRVISKIKVLE